MCPYTRVYLYYNTFVYVVHNSTKKLWKEKKSYNIYLNVISTSFSLLLVSNMGGVFLHRSLLFPHFLSYFVFLCVPLSHFSCLIMSHKRCVKQYCFAGRSSGSGGDSYHTYTSRQKHVFFMRFYCNIL